MREQAQSLGLTEEQANDYVQQLAITLFGGMFYSHSVPADIDASALWALGVIGGTDSVSHCPSMYGGMDSYAIGHLFYEDRPHLVNVFHSNAAVSGRPEQSATRD